MNGYPAFGPERDRRRHKRWLTKKTVGITFLVVFALFTAVSIWSEVSDKARFGQGRLYSKRMKIPELAPRQPYEVVSGEEISSSRGADPMLLDYARREAMLGVEPGMLERQHGIAADATMLDVEDSAFGMSLDTSPGTSTAEVKITGGPEGVRIEKRQ